MVHTAQHTAETFAQTIKLELSGNRSGFVAERLPRLPARTGCPGRTIRKKHRPDHTQRQFVSLLVAHKRSNREV